jgi:hypothetical protein
MKIEFPPGCPQEAQAAALARVTALVSWHVVPIEAGALTLSMPHPVFVVRTLRIRAGMELRDAVDAAGWRFLVRKGTEVKAAVQVREDGATWRVSSVKMGSWATRTKDALDKAYGEGSEQPEVSAWPSYLWCRATWTAALWFRATDPEHDRVVALPYVRGELKPLTPYTAKKFMEETVKQVPPPPEYDYGYF